jgi:hypothetical protein
LSLFLSKDSKPSFSQYRNVSIETPYALAIVPIDFLLLIAPFFA